MNTKTRSVWLPSDCIYGGCTDRSTIVSYPYKDLADFAVRNVEDCCAICRLRLDCVAWAVRAAGSDPTHCWVKFAIGDPYTDHPEITMGLVIR